MLHTEQILKLLQTNKQLLFGQYSLTALGVFGSAVRSDFTEKSDIDIIVNIDESLGISEYGNCYWNIQFGLEDLLRREIDLITECSIKNPYFKMEVDNMKVAIL